MILIDANVLLRYFVHSSDLDRNPQIPVARALIEAAERGEIELSTTGVVLHEAAYLMTAKAHYGMPVASVVAALTTLLHLPGFWLPAGEKKRYLDALELWARYPALGFADSLLATVALETESELASFDRDFDRVPGLRHWIP